MLCNAIKAYTRAAEKNVTNEKSRLRTWSARHTSMKPQASIKLRWHLVVLIVATLVPMLIFAAILMQREIKQQQENVDRGMRYTARALSLAVDREISSARGVLDTLEGSQSIDERNFPRFYRLAAAAAAKRQGSRVILFALDGQQLVNTARPLGDSLPNPFQEGQPQGKNSVYPDLVIGGNVHLKQVIETGQPTVSDVFITLTNRRPGISIGVPVKRNNKLLYILDIVFELGTFTRLLLEEAITRRLGRSDCRPPGSYRHSYDGSGAVCWPARGRAATRADGQGGRGSRDHAESDRRIDLALFCSIKFNRVEHRHRCFAKRRRTRRSIALFIY